MQADGEDGRENHTQRGPPKITRASLASLFLKKAGRKKPGGGGNLASFPGDARRSLWEKEAEARAADRLRQQPARARGALTPPLRPREKGRLGLREEL